MNLNTTPTKYTTYIVITHILFYLNLLSCHIFSQENNCEALSRIQWVCQVFLLNQMWYNPMKAGYSCFRNSDPLGPWPPVVLLEHVMTHEARPLRPQLKWRRSVPHSDHVAAKTPLVLLLMEIKCFHCSRLHLLSDFSLCHLNCFRILIWVRFWCLTSHYIEQKFTWCTN